MRSVDASQLTASDYRRAMREQKREAALALAPLAEKHLSLLDDAAYAEAALLVARQALRYHEEVVLPDAMRAAGVDAIEVDLSTGERAALKTVDAFHFDIADNRGAEPYIWLQENGHGDRLEHRPPYKINRATLRAILREALESGAFTECERALFSIHEYQTATTKIKKAGAPGASASNQTKPDTGDQTNDDQS